MAKKEILVTQEGLEKLKAELQNLVEVRRPEIVNRIKTAKELGDLSENAEYVSAKEEQSFIEGRVQEIEQTLKHVKVADTKRTGTIEIGASVEVDVEGDKFDLEIVGETESDLDMGKVAVDSPVAKALLGHKKGDKVEVQTPDGSVTYHIVAIK